MDLDQAWRAIDRQRRAVADLLLTLGEREWDRPSLCEGWTVRDVAAHLTLQQSGLREVVGGIRRHPFTGMNTLIYELARDKAAAPPEQLIAEIVAMIGSRRHNIGVTHRETMIDILVHSQDLSMPLGRSLPIDPVAAAHAADRVWSRGWPFHPRRRLAGVRLRADDVHWTVGDGPLAQGPMEALLLLSTGRPVALERLAGDGAELLRARSRLDVR